MKITIISVGKIKEKFYRDAAAEYAKRLGRYCRLELVEVEDEKTPDRASPAQEDRIREKEAERILRHIREDSCLITLEIAGQMCDSVEFSKKLDSLGIQGVSHIQFVIGGSLGLHGKVCERADMALSFSRMTFPHQMMRIILLEQIYRGYRIINREPYHK